MTQYKDERSHRAARAQAWVPGKGSAEGTLWLVQAFFCGWTRRREFPFLQYCGQVHGTSWYVSLSVHLYSPTRDRVSKWSPAEMLYQLVLHQQHPAGSAAPFPNPPR